MPSKFWTLARVICWASLSVALSLTACGGGRGADSGASASRVAFSYIDGPSGTGTAKSAAVPGAKHAIALNAEVFYALFVGDQFELSVPELGSLVVTVTTRAQHLQQAVSIVGTAPVDEVGSARVQLAASGQAITGLIRVGEREWHVNSDAQGSRLQELAAAGIETRSSHSPEVFNAASQRIELSTASPLDARERVKSVSTFGQADSAAPVLKVATASTVSTIDMAFISDVSYQQRMGGENQELADIAYILTAANTAYADSGAFVQLRMAEYRRASFDWSNTTMQQALTDMLGFSGSFAGQWPARIGSGADVAIGLSALTAAKEGCGLAPIGTVRFNGAFSTNTPAMAAQVVRGTDGTSFCSDYTLAHEVGHIMGSQHDRANSTGPGAFSYSYGYGVTNLFGDIMSYLRPRQPFFSSPNVLKCLGSRACGTATDDSVRTFNETSAFVTQALDPATRLSGIYWDPSASGTGWTIDASNGRILATAFVYDAAGNSTWFTGIGSACASNPASYCVVLNEYKDGQTLTGPYKPASLKQKVADAQLTFSAGYPATLVVDMPGVRKTLQRYIFEPTVGLTTKPTVPGTLLPATYWNPLASGTGVFMERQGSTIVGTAFYYRANGQAAWATTQGVNYNVTASTATSYSYSVSRMNLVTFANGQTLTGSYRAPSILNPIEAYTYMEADTGYWSVFNAQGSRMDEIWTRFAY